ncbi:acyl-CoA carboxylase subunit epsilon [Streptomyces sp. NBC_00236]|uniref:acyl-CoA carboxylase subunit epsilon n=1 Tax=unclassified Streptomyces TaxID=2593676 RepID=UPI002E2C0F2E|nr:acyl-CoA carboxylase subunit epsilon [Streptomyces sp. NBC_00236]
MTTAPCSPVSGAADPDHAGPVLRFLGGAPSAEEIAAVTAALLSLRRAPADRPEAGRGVAPWQNTPLHYRPPGSWAAR